MGLSFLAITLVISCKDNDTNGPAIANEISLLGDIEQTVVEGDLTGDITLSYEFAVAARASGSVTINTVADNLTYGVNYTTNPAESSNAITINFSEGEKNISLDITVIDDQLNLPDGSVVFTLGSIQGEESEVSSSAASFTLTIQDNEGESITLDSQDLIKLGEVIPGTSSDAKEATFTTINVVSDMTATASEGFVVSDALDGTYAGTATLTSTATSVFVKAMPSMSSALGESKGTVTLSVADVSQELTVNAIVASAIGRLFWVENFDYPSDETYPAYADDYPSSYGAESSQQWGIVPVSARYRANAKYNGTDASVPVIKGLERADVFDTWYTTVRFRAVAMGDGPLTFEGYPGSGVGRTARLAQDYSNLGQRGDCKNEGAFLSKNTVLLRRFVNNGDEITSGNVYFSAMLKVNELFDESTSTLKNAVMMLTGDASFVGANAMKLNIQNDGSGGYNIGVSKSGDDGSVVYGSNSYTVGETYAVIVKVEVKEDLEGDNPNDVLSVYVFKSGDVIPEFEDTSVLTAEAQVDETNQDLTDIHDVTSGLELFFVREVADVFGAGGIDKVAVHDVEFSGIRIATSWSALLQDASGALYDSQSEDGLQTRMYGRSACETGPPEKINNQDK